MISRSRREKEVKQHIREMLPNVTLADFEKIVEISDRGHLRHLPPSIIAWQSITTHIRHNHTEYDDLLDDGYEPEAARHYVLDKTNEILSSWGSTKLIEETDGEQQ